MRGTAQPMGEKRRYHLWLERWCRAIYEKHPDLVSVAFFDGPWILEVYSSSSEDVPVRAIDDMPEIIEALRMEVAWLTKQRWFSGFEGLAEGFEWRLCRGAH